MSVIRIKLHLFYTMILFIFCIIVTQTAIIVTTQQIKSSTSSSSSLQSSSKIQSTSTKCFGNFVYFINKCVSCQPGQIAQSNRCVKLLGWGYGSNLIQPQPQNISFTNINNNITNSLPNCNKISQQNNSLCSECIMLFDLIDGKCIQQSCKIYSQVLGKCLDNLKQAQIELLTVKMQNRSQNQRVIPAQQVYIIGGPLSRMEVMLIDNIVSLTLPTLALKMPQNQLNLSDNSTNLNNLKQFKQNQNLPTNTTNNQKKPINSILIKQISSIPGCLTQFPNIKQCQQCRQGYILNILINQCKFITSAIIFPTVGNNTNNPINNFNNQ